MKLADHSIFRRPQFVLERWVQRGVLHQLLLMASLVAGVAVLGGLSAWTLTSKFESLTTAIWWSFLRLTDPGYLGDDEGAALRTISTVVTILGYVLFMGSLIAIMTQWLALTIRKLESGLTPIAMRNHFVILGWTNRTPEIIKKLLNAEGRLERFLARRSGSRTLRIVVLADEVDAGRRLELRESLGADWNDSQVFLRSGSSLHPEHLARLDLLNASVIIVPGADFELGGAELNDTRVVKTLMSLDALFTASGKLNSPCVVAELFDPRKVPIARSSLSTRAEIIAGDRLISRVLSQSLRHPGVGAVLMSLLTHREGNGLYLRSFSEFVDLPIQALSTAFPEAILMGVVSPGGDSPTVALNPNPNYRLKENDSLLLLAKRYGHCYPSTSIATPDSTVSVRSLPPRPAPAIRRILILGWSYKIPTLLAELQESADDRFEVTIFSRVPKAERRQLLVHFEPSDGLTVLHAFGDYSLDQDLRRLEPHTFDNVVFLASGWMKSSEEADARTVMGLLLLRSLLANHASSPEILTEFLDPGNAELFNDTGDVILVSPRILSHLLAHVGLLPQLNAAFESLICSGGAEVILRPAGDLGIDSPTVTFAEIQRAATGKGCIALGFHFAPESNSTQQVMLNPDRTQQRTLGQRDRVILLHSETDRAQV